MLIVLWWVLRASQNNKKMWAKERMKQRTIHKLFSWMRLPISKDIVLFWDYMFSTYPIISYASRPSHVVMTHVDNIEVGTFIQQMDHCWEAWPPHSCSMLRCEHIHLWWDWLVKQSIIHNIGACKGCNSLSSQYWCRTSFEKQRNCILGTCPLSHSTPCQDLRYFSLSKGTTFLYQETLCSLWYPPWTVQNPFLRNGQQ